MAHLLDCLIFIWISSLIFEPQHFLSQVSQAGRRDCAASWCSVLDKPNVASLAICLAPGKKWPHREKDLGRPLRRGLKGEERTKMAWVHLTGLAAFVCKATQVNPSHFSPFLPLLPPPKATHISFYLEAPFSWWGSFFSNVSPLRVGIHKAWGSFFRPWFSTFIYWSVESTKKELN